MPLHELVYVSLAGHDMPPAELCELLTQARERNREREITGLLVYRNREFMQLIEGEREVVLALFHKIEDDPRHRHVYKIWDAPIAQRSCQNWSMGYAELTTPPGTRCPMVTRCWTRVWWPPVARPQASA